MKSILQKANEPLYNYEPYFNRRDGQPSWQWKFLGATDKYKGRVALGGNRIGKSDQGAFEVTLAALGLHPHKNFPQKGKAWIVGYNYNKTRDICLPKFEKFLPSYARENSHYNKQDKIWHVQTPDRDWIVQFKSADAGRRAFDSEEIDFIWFDEEMPEEIFTECMMRLIDRKGIWCMTATPVLGTAWLKAKSEEKGVFCTTGAMRDNPYLPEEEISIAEENMTEDEKLVRIEGQYIIFGGKPVFDLAHLRSLLDGLNKGDHPVGVQGALGEAA